MSKKYPEPRQTPLDSLLRAADVSVLRRLIKGVVARRPELRRKCLEFLEKHVSVPQETRAAAAGDAARALWEELAPDLAKLNEYGGGPDAIEHRVANLLYRLEQKLQQGPVPREVRQWLRNEVVSYILSGNAGMEDGLYGVADATCQDDEDWYDFAEQLEAAGQDWPRGRARRIYRKLGDREKYLALRLQRMQYGGDYHDLATFYRDQGEQDKALAVAREGMTKGQGRMDELRAFLAECAEAEGDRHSYLELQFAQATSRLSLESYTAFHDLCKAEEWPAYESRLVSILDSVRPEKQLPILMHRGEYEKAMRLLSAQRYPDRWSGTNLLQTATELEEERYPAQILTFYLSGLGKLKQSASRSVYAQKAEVARKVRHMWLDVLKEPEKWEQFARSMKAANQNRPAFQEEFARVVPGWRGV